MKRLLILALLLLSIGVADQAWASEEIGRQEDTASADAHVTMPMGCVRSDTPAETTSTDGDYSHVKCKTGKLYTLTTLEAGTATFGKLGANAGVIIGDVNVVGSLPTGNNTLGNVNVTSIAPGTGATSLGKSEDAVHSTGDVGVMILGVRRDTPGTGVGADGDYVNFSTDGNGRLYTSTDSELPAPTTLADNTANPTLPAVAAYIMCWDTATWDRCPGGLTDTDDGTIATSQIPNLAINLNYKYDGANWTRMREDPCASGNKIFVTISQTTNTQLLAGTASTRTYVCSIQVMTATTQNISLVSGTGAVCATSVGPMLGGSSSATGWNFAANGGIVIGGAGHTIAKTDTDADNVCLIQSGAGQVSGSLSYVAAAN
jgi:hypothetical protein